ncbi:hypothetical protein [Consotaella salsifontis]|uniref:Uncharacterized protein n=1 Tax=Consotaella salsifontis TaxID=1365950 RepID=A0A1T4NR75_9HYPH|nr:hypothetical protein [Consotaella salsifontis]SJZ81597.1 hypothetical protein SAMN05428963_103137 [Consotaella salsifontis]
MLDIRNRHTAVRERLLAEALQEIVAELRLVDVVDYIAFLRMGEHGNIGDIVRSSSELHMKPGVLRFADGGEIDLNWGSVPVIALDLEFRHEPVVVHFRLELGAVNAAVDIRYIEVEDGEDATAAEVTDRLRHAIEASKIKPQPVTSVA